MANLAQSVNVISPLSTTPDGILKQATWYPLLLFSRHMRGQTLAVHVRCGEYKGDTQPGWIRGSIQTPWLDVSAAKGPDGSVCLAVVNIHEEKEFETELRGLDVDGKNAAAAAAAAAGGGGGGGVHVYTVTGRHVRVGNTVEKEEVGLEYCKWDGKGAFTFPKHSLTMLKWKPPHARA
jgi:alpha-N-arabinofuranosidase